VIIIILIIPIIITLGKSFLVFPYFSLCSFVRSIKLTIFQLFGASFLNIFFGEFGVQLQYVQQVKYLGVMLVSARSFKHSISHVKEKFYRCFNAMYYRSRNAGSECVSDSVQLIKYLCIPIIFTQLRYFI